MHFKRQTIFPGEAQYFYICGWTWSPQEDSSGGDYFVV